MQNNKDTTTVQERIMQNSKGAATVQDKAPEEKSSEIRGGRNLLILGFVSVGIAVITTVVSLIIYHRSGDIYLDRSRPGFLPDEEEVLKKPETTYSFPSSGVLTSGDIDDYVLHFEEAVEVIDDLHSPFSEAPLSDESLGIPPESNRSEDVQEELF